MFEYQRYSTDIAAAWKVVEKLISQGKSVEIYGSARGNWGVNQEVADSAPLAICLAALKAVDS